MTVVDHPRSRMVQVSASLLLSTAYFVAAIGVWMVHQGQLNTSADTAGSSTLSCTTSTGQTTDSFDALADGAALPTDWSTHVGTNTAIAVSKDAGKTGNGIKLVDSYNEGSADAYNGYVGMSHAIVGGSTGSVEADVNIQAGSGNHSLTIGIGNTKGQFIYTYLMNGTFRYWNQSYPGGYATINSNTWQTNTWYHIKIAWSPSGFDYFVNDQKITGSPLPFSYPADVTTNPPNSINILSTYDANGVVGTYYVDNVSYPGCPSAAQPLAFTANPASGTAPLVVTATTSSTLSGSSTTTCAADDPGSTATDTFDAFTAGTTDFGWQRLLPPGGYAYPAPEAAKSGNGLAFAGAYGIADGTNRPAWTSRHIGTLPPTANNLAVSFDVQAKPGTDFNTIVPGTDAGLNMTINNAQGELIHTDIANGTFKYWNGVDYPTIKPGFTVQTGQWYHVTISWNQAGWDFSVNGVKLNSSPLPFAIPNTSALADFGIYAGTGWYYLDNVTYPSCSSTLTWDFGDGSAKVTGTVTTMQHTYQTAGTYTITLMRGTQTATQTVTVNAATTAPATPTLTIDPASGPSPLTVKATLGNTNGATYTIDFGDGSAVQVGTGDATLTHTYRKTGSFVVTGTANGQATKRTVTVDAAASVPAPAAASAPPIPKLISAGGSLPINLGIAALLSLVTTVLLLRRRSVA